jgi:glycine/D-amino acid oxidase-like deaminating enzyme
MRRAECNRARRHCRAWGRPPCACRQPAIGQHGVDKQPLRDDTARRHGPDTVNARASRERIVVLGAGLTGAAVALALAQAGRAVTNVDQDERPLNRASLRNEGKIHLGFIYAHDASLATARLQLAGALAFRALLAAWIGPRAASLRLSTPFTYLVAHDSLLGASALEAHYSAIEGLFADQIRTDAACDYLGLRPSHLFERLPLARLAPHLRPDKFAAAFRTEERAVDTAELAALVRSALRDQSQVTFLPRHKALVLKRAAGGFIIDGDAPNGPWRLPADQVVNALWEERLRFDRMAGLAPPAGWLHRLKYRVIARLPEGLRNGPSVTVVLGRYGDVVVRADGTAYLSWYPAGLQGWSHEETPPPAWEMACRGEAAQPKAREIGQAILAGIDAWYPGIAQAQPLLVDAGAIVAYGSSDVDQPASGLHERTRIGVTSWDGFHSIDPGKLTTAPLFAAEAARRILAV